MREFSGFRLTRIGKADDHELGIGIVLQAQRHVVTDALAQVVKARNSGFHVAAIADLGGLRRWRGLLNVDSGRSVRGASTAVADGALHGVIAGLRAGGVKLYLCAAAGDLATAGGVAVSQRIVVGITGRRGDGGTLSRKNRAAFRGARDGGILVRLGFDLDICRASGGSALAVIHLYVDGITSGANASGTPAHFRSGAFDGAAGGGIGVGQGIVIGIARGHVHGNWIARSGINRHGAGRAGGHGNAVWRRRRIGNPKAQHDSSGRANVILPGIGVERRAGKISHQVIDLRETPGDVLPNHDVHTATGRECEGRLRFVAGHLGPSTSAADQEFSKGDEVVEAAKIEARPKEISGQPAILASVVSSQGENVAGVGGAAHFGIQAQPARGVESEGAGAAVIVKILERLAWAEINVFVHEGEFVTGYQPSRFHIFGVLGVLRTRKWPGPGSIRQSEKIVRRRDVSGFRRRGACFGRFFPRAVFCCGAFLLS